jgi:hypothetical protein
MPRPRVETTSRLRGASTITSIVGAFGRLRPSVVHHREKFDELRAGWIYTVPVEWPADAGGRIAVTVQEMTSGLRGGALAKLPASP